MHISERIIKEIAGLGAQICYLNEQEAQKYLEKDVDLFFDLSMLEVEMTGRDYSAIYFLLKEKLYVYVVLLERDGEQIGAYFLWDTEKPLIQHCIKKVSLTLT